MQVKFLAGAVTLGLALGSGCSGGEQSPSTTAPPPEPAPAPAPQYDIKGALNDTGITTCADNERADLPCPVAEFPEQDGAVGRDADPATAGPADGAAGFSWTKLDANGASSAVQGHPWADGGDPAVGMRWSCLQDNVTGLVWEVKESDDKHPRWAGHTYSWYSDNEATNGGAAGRPDGGSCPTAPCDTQSYVGYVNSQKLCGFEDWRLPTVSELSALSLLSKASPAIDTAFFPNVPSPRFFTSESVAETPTLAWYVYFSNGSVSATNKGDASQLRLVRGGAR